VIMVDGHNGHPLSDQDRCASHFYAAIFQHLLITRNISLSISCKLVVILARDGREPYTKTNRRSPRKRREKKKKTGVSSQWTLVENCSVPNLSKIQHRHSVKVISIQQLVTLASSIALRIEFAIIN
jgi:hypothetical protein